MPKKTVSCPVEVTLGVIAGRWKVMIIHQLLEGTKRFNQLQRELAGITHRTLAKQLREMEGNGLVERRDYKEIPPRVEYRLSPLGLTLKDILRAMHVWAETHADKVPRKRDRPGSIERPPPSSSYSGLGGNRGGAGVFVGRGDKSRLQNT